MTHSILIVDDEPKLLDVLAGMLEQMGYRALTASSGAAALQTLDRDPVDLVLCDLRMPGMGGRELLAEMSRRGHKIPLVIMTAYSSVRDAVAVIKEGAFDYIDKPIELDDLTATLSNALRLQDALRDNARLREELEGRHRFDTLVGVSPAFQTVLRSISEVCAAKTTVLLTGESGTGKEVVARAIHFNSPRSAGPFVAVNCAAVPEALLESEFFGHVKGSFTGAVANRVGRFGQADNGTLFLDEIGDMPLALQAKILRVLQDHVYEPVGSTLSKTTDVRIIAATNRDLEKMVAAGQFRGDLFYRLNVFAIPLPALRDRREDIPLFLDRFVAEFGPALGKKGLSFSPDAVRALCAYPWPGNIRELQNCVERSVLSARRDVIEASDLPPYIGQTQGPSGSRGDIVFPMDLDDECARFERQRIIAALKQTDGVQVRAAEILGITERSLWHRVKKLGISVTRAVAGD
ncbi:acetoacetate metabolism regulatory protein AtoC [Alsobacter metallidurans]|uniref:Acetoacetate metabolism regulatory protein AtoC n=1 Tax=Alsobacter metallidurans TaxID=340221 RepID=A0A917I6T6_9HYPH|nr:sigma-54 dependent transcriptional regulator [Alsobacter metallidurans]GGH19021.1 acetoacetate metabolism regulatory protein AtoC [Alsobacter metallidurans]